MSITHGWTTAEPNDPTYDVSATNLNAHTVPDGELVAAKVAFAATARLLGRNTAGAGNGEEVTPAQARAMLDLEVGTDILAFAAAVSQAEAEAGTEAALRTWSPLRVAQAIAALAAGGAALAHGFAAVAADETTTTGTYVDLTTPGPAVTITVNTKVKITLSADNYGSLAGTTSRMSVALSGANTLAADDVRSLCYVSYDNSSNDQQASRVIYLSGLTPGSTVFTAKYKRGITGTAHWRYRELLVECLD